VVPVSGGRFALNWPGVSEAAGWLVVATGGGARTELFLEGDANRYAWWDGEQQADQTPRPARPTPMALTAPDQVEVGEDFEVTTTAPYAGWVLWTVESDRVLSHRWEKVEAGPIRFSPEVEDFTPNVYVSAFLIKDPHLESAAAFLPGRAYGARSVRVRPEAFEQPVKIEVAAEARPFAPLEVKLDLGRLSAPATATVAIVDEGVLQITRFETPNPLHRVFARRQLGVESFETVGWTLMMEPGGPSSRTGGDGAGGSLGRVQLVKPVALWSGPVTVGVDGKATVKVDLPGYRGKLRVMAVASAGAKLGSAEASVVVRDPIVIQTTPPRVLATGDEVEVPVFVSNQTGKDVQVEVKLAAEALAGVQQVGVPDGAAPVRLLGADRTTLNLKVGQSDVAVFRLRSDAVRGAARLRVTATGGGEQSRDELDVPLVPARAEEHRTVSLALTDMVDVDAALDAGGWVDGADRTQIIVTDNPYTASLGRITDLVRYPYGCIEQTVSSTRPLLALRALMPGLDADLVAQAPVDARVKAGIDRVLSMQTPSGGFSYWPGGADAHAWGTAYATHLLLDAKEARFDVPQVALDEALTYLERSGLSAGSPGQDSGAAYAHYVLARGGRARAGEAQRLLEQLPADGRGQIQEARTLLMAAVQLTGDRRHEGALRKPVVPAQLEARSNDWTFYSELRRAGLLLNIVEELFPGDKGSEALAQAVAEAIGRRDGRWYTTQELAWAVSGLGKRVSASGSTLPPVQLAADGRALSATAAPTGPVWALNGASAVVDLALRTQGAPAQARVLLRTHGVRSVPEVVESAGLRLERVALTTVGGVADLRSQALGDRLFVKMSVENLRPVEVSNLAVVGRLPAGWEVESARVPVDPFAPEGQEALAAWTVDHVNVRDDRIELFGTLPGGQTRTVWLELRATSAGRFTWPGMTAEAMYDPNVWARLPSSQVEVRGPWTGSVL
jgi:uncharacterized protein YfaS (alpha-2-macroglobulin family)